MTETPAIVQTDWNGAAMQRRIRRRYAAERRFKWLGLSAILLSAGFLAFLLFTMIGNGMSGFTRTKYGWTSTRARQPVPGSGGMSAASGRAGIASAISIRRYPRRARRLMVRGRGIFFRRSAPAPARRGSGRSVDSWRPAQPMAAGLDRSRCLREAPRVSRIGSRA